MKDLQSIIQSIDVSKLLEHYNFKPHEEDDELFRSACKIHNGDNPTSFVINKESTLWYCHTGCGGGDVFTLVQKMEKCSFTDAIAFIVKFYNLDFSDIAIQELLRANQKELHDWMEYNKKLKLNVPFEECPITPVTREIASYRDFNKSTLEQFGVKYVDEISLINRKGEYYTLNDRIFFPIYFQNIYIGFSLRKVKEHDIMKWSHQPRDINISRVLFNYDNVKDADDITVVEGIIDVLACYEANIPAVATFGAHMSLEQEKLLLQTGADITLAYDGDSAGRAGMKDIRSRMRNKATLRQVQFPDGEDCQSIKRNDLFTLYNNRIKI